jgi:WD40 repeat protein
VVTRPVVHTLPPRQEPVNAVAFSPDGKLLAIGTGDWRTENPGEVELWDPASGKHISNAWHSPRDVKALAFSPDGKRLAIAHAAARTAGGAGAVAIVGVLTAAPGGSLSCPTGATAVGFSPDGRIVAAGQWNGKIRLWDAATLAPLVSRPIPAHSDMIFDLAFTPDGKHIATASKDGTVKV